MNQRRDEETDGQVGIVWRGRQNNEDESRDGPEPEGRYAKPREARLGKGGAMLNE